MAETKGTADGTDQLADRVRDFNERIIELSRQTSEATLGAYAKMLQSIADLEENIGKASPVDWLTTFTTAQANFTRDLAEAYTAAARKMAG